MDSHFTRGVRRPPYTDDAWMRGARAGILGNINSDGGKGGLIPAPPPAARESYSWPVPGEGAAAVKDAVGHNGLRFSDGRYSPAGAFRNGRPHYGIDLPAKQGDAVRSAGPGTVYASGPAKGWGNYIAIRHDDGRIGVYAHVSAVEPLKVGERVLRGQKIASVGDTGNAKGSGTHLHFEVREDVGRKTLRRIADGAVAINPAKWINGHLDPR